MIGKFLTEDGRRFKAEYNYIPTIGRPFRYFAAYFDLIPNDGEIFYLIVGRKKSDKIKLETDSLIYDISDTQASNKFEELKPTVILAEVKNRNSDKKIYHFRSSELTLF